MTLQRPLCHPTINILAAGALLGAALLSATPALAEGYVGKVCLQGTIKERETGPVADQIFTVSYDVNHLGGTSYSLTGNVNMPDPFIFTGNGSQIGNILYMNITTTQSHADGWRDAGVMQIQLNMTTMSGTFYENGHDFDRINRRWDQRYTAGVVSRVACP